MKKQRTRFLVFCLVLLLGGSVGLPEVSGQQRKNGKDAENSESQEVQSTAPKRVWDGDTIRFITDSDFPPFNYYDEEGVLTGFNVDLARAICLVVDVSCDIQARDWDTHINLIEGGEADAIIASLAINSNSLARVDFTNPYFQMPARFAARTDSKIKDVKPETVEGLKIGVLHNTAHEAYMRNFFSKAEIVPFDRALEARQALKTGKVDLLFDDGVSLMFWINGTLSDGCCEFRGGAFIEATYFGQGIGVAVKKGNRKLLKALNDALDQVREEGRLEQLYLRYFPLRFY